MGKVYGGVAGIKAPEFKSGVDYKEFAKEEEAYVEAVKDVCRKAGKCKEAGDEIRFSVADGQACYVVLNLKPVELVHLAVGDKYQEQYVHRLTAKDIRDRIVAERALSKLFGKKVA